MRPSAFSLLTILLDESVAYLVREPRENARLPDDVTAGAPEGHIQVQLREIGVVVIHLGTRNT